MTTVPDPARLLADAARTAVRAPSLFNAQPWRWHVTGDALELSADPARALPATDPDGRLQLIGCGAALHHARVALAAAGYTAEVTRLPGPSQSKIGAEVGRGRDEPGSGRPGVLARIRVGAAAPADDDTRAMAAAIERRRTDRRGYAGTPVPESELDRLRYRVEAEGAYLHVVRPEQVPALAVAADRAAAAQTGDPAYRAELDAWTSRPAGSGDGVPAATAVQQSPRRVPVRDFAPAGEPGLTADGRNDRGDAYLVLFGRTDRPIDLLRGGEALSALLLTATADGLATEPLSDAAEVTWSRTMLRGLLAGVGEPYLAIRVGHPGSGEPPPAAPRRDPAEIITIERNG